MTDKAIQIRQTFNPQKDTTQAEKAAKKLVDIVKQQGWAIKVGNGEHLLFSAWQTLGKYYGYTVRTFEAEPISIGEVQGFKAKAEVIDNKTGFVIGGAEAYCMKDEFNWGKKPLFQLASMAQTRSGSKALRQILAFVVAIAGYSETPAEEMTGEEHKEEKTLSFPATSKQLNFIKGMLKKKGYEESDLTVKYGAMDKLTMTDASKIINNLSKLPDIEITEEDREIEITDEDLDRADEAISKK